MEHYECLDGKGFHIFNYARDEGEALQAIIKWWNGVDKTDKTIHSITFRFDDDNTITAEVSWAWLTEQKEKQLEALIETPVELTASIPSNN